MHDNSLNECLKFSTGLIVHRGHDPLSIADVGSFDVNGTYRPLFIRDNWRYVGFDIRAGGNVDVVLYGHDDWQLQAEHREAFDVVISGQCMEHVAAPWRWIKNVASLMRPGALLWLAVPNTEVFHEHPIDAWRVWPDGMRAIFAEGGLTEILCEVHGPDTIGIARKARCAT